jgi:hypothetical protein
MVFGVAKLSDQLGVVLLQTLNILCRIISISARAHQSVTVSKRGLVY